MSYLLWANIYLAIFYGFYWICLRQETFFQFNRCYLLSSAIFSFALPLIDLNITSFTIQSELFTSTLPEVQIIGAAGLGHSPSTLLFVYLIGCFISSVLFLRKFYLVKKNAKTLNTGDAYSFFHLIKVDPKLVGYDEIVAHEQVHIRQLHSLDVLILEIVKIINWFNPIVYLYISAVKLNHEYIADNESVKHQDQRIKYANLLVRQAFNTPGYSLWNNFFNKPILKKRIVMLFKNRSKKSVLVRFSMLIPVMLIAFGFQTKKENLLNGSTSDKLIVQKQSTELTTDTTKKYTAVETPPQPVGGMQAFYKFVGNPKVEEAKTPEPTPANQ